MQSVLVDAFRSMLQEDITVYGSGRTDAGVHALGQVAHICTNNRHFSCDRILKGINSLLPEDVKLKGVVEVTGDFHARFSAVNRYYQYRLTRYRSALQRRFAWYPECVWDDQSIVEAVSLLPGEHSFKSFSKARPGEDDYICRVFDARWETDETYAIFHIRADRFMHRMVRGIIGALVDVGRGYLAMERFRDLLLNPKFNGAVRTAPSQGLTLIEVSYPGNNLHADNKLTKT